MGSCATATRDLEAAIRAPRLNRQKISQDDVDFRNPVRRCDARPMKPALTRRQTMRVMVIVKATEDSERGFRHTAEEKAMMEAMGRFNDELHKAGIMLHGDGLKPSSQGKRIAFNGPRRTVIDGPFAETRELVAGFWICAMCYVLCAGFQPPATTVSPRTTATGG
jgi:hypothetical protein